MSLYSRGGMVIHAFWKVCSSVRGNHLVTTLNKTKLYWNSHESVKVETLRDNRKLEGWIQTSTRIDNRGNVLETAFSHDIVI